ncbi:MAG: DNA-directed RNA polymerase subunit beta' [Candidatus Levybacteria bacterium RIFCSPHIGHO2_02_FULL_39_36]|nr:MAG: DNA-directed RNA polymerase subunit beta' [Candidatus Levybacteria bacterium GW2011_GWA1_39_11]KKR24551.1 MAG: DNA-directed RNA polymerase subunit beta' [Candidatus Levybacteria bacterium GW2011_GWB1_39_7]OGH14794.1 MAG: DNA-directed RNA polymerase subunit beta' [Candidatus Levybacteria bacterium RIFCSPHIGHO2_01_FULL_38_96]OGH26063.1 MAG: DNA-directed RNA polymerase subunit beta' [Candidatus Levybacteria bacterium RIFCSPHIGHO2_12_FULL_39_39]OGH27352.1 MAG: DNA-directed RNA polymerase su
MEPKRNKERKFDPINIADFKGLRVLIANPDDIKQFSYGEVVKPETINYRTYRPEKDGLFDERIFGPTRDFECYCGKYKRIRYKGIVCDRCGVEVTYSRVRRERMGHISLASPVVHIWFSKGSPSKLSVLLDIPQKDLESVIYFASYLVTKIDEDKRKEAQKILADIKEERIKKLKQQAEDEAKQFGKEEKSRIKEVKKTLKKEQKELVLEETDVSFRQRRITLEKRLETEITRTEEIFTRVNDIIKSLRLWDVLSEEEYVRLIEYEMPMFFEVETGASAVLHAIELLDLAKLIGELREEVQKSSGQKQLKLLKRQHLVESMNRAGSKPVSLVLQILPVLPPDLRPMVQLNGGRFATSDLNDLYRRVINRNNRLKHLISLGAPEIILRNEKRMLQESVDYLIDTSIRTSQTQKQFKSLSDILRGKQGRFRKNLLGKRVDYSGRSVIIVGPELRLNQCGLPKEMALELFKPFVIREVIARGLTTPNVKAAKRFIEKRSSEIFDILEEITKNHPVLLNRAPTLHKLGIQAFYPVLIEGSAIKIHPCVCAGYNADFDGDQMAIHIPLSSKAQEEAMKLMMPAHNLLKPADGSPITLPNKEMALGAFYLTSIDERLRKKNLPIFSDEKEAHLAFSLKKIALREPIKARIKGDILETSIGRIMFNERLPAELGFINSEIKASTIKQIVTRAMVTCDDLEVADLIDNLKEIGFLASTMSGISVSTFDLKRLPNKEKLIEEAEGKIKEIEEEYQNGLITQNEQRRLSNNVWLEATDNMANLTWELFDKNDIIRIIAESGGARAGKDQIKQLAAMRGLIYDPMGRIVELPIKSNFREGLSIFEYVNSARGSRKGLTDSALKTADAGYLTRRLVDVAHDVIIREKDCNVEEGITVSMEKRADETYMTSMLLGRVVLKDVVSKKNRKTIVKRASEIDYNKLPEIIKDETINEIHVRSPLFCKLRYGICANCYGWDLSTYKLADTGTPVGVIAAQSIGEPGTQLTMRVRHFGGVVMSDVTQGLPRVEELFEVRRPKVLAPVAEISGKTQVNKVEDGYIIRIRNTKVKPVEEREYFVPLTSTLLVQEGQAVTAGTQLCEGYLDPRDVLKISGLKSAQHYLISQIQSVYESQGISIHYKHFETIIRKMSDKVMIETPGDTTLMPGDLVSKLRFEEENASVISEGGEPASAREIILGVTKASLVTDSWLSAASFQETTQVLTDASLEGRVDNLIGLKENVIVGRLIPVREEFIEGELSLNSPSQ